MRKLPFILAGAVVVASLGLLAYQRQQQPLGLSDLYEEYHLRGPKRDIQSPFNGAVLVARDGEVVFKRAYGFADVERQKPLTPQSRFFVGHGSKPFTAALVMRQVEAGVLDLEGNVSDYLPDFPSEPGARITLHHLLTHSSGLPRDELDDESPALEFEPGTRYEFSNVGYTLLIRILEEASGRSFEDLLDEGIVTPLGLTDTGWAARDELPVEATQGLRFNEHPYPIALMAPGPGTFENVRPPAGGTVYTSVEDFYRFMQGLRNHELLSAETTERLFRAHHEGAAGGWFRNRLWVLRRHTQARLYTHIGYLGGHSALAAMYDDGTDVIVLSNCSPLSLDNILHDTWLAAHGLRELETDLPHPSLSSVREFLNTGGLESYYDYYSTLSERAGYTVKPERGQAEQVVRLLLRRELYDDAARMADTIAETWAPADDDPLNTVGYLFLEREQFELARKYLQRNTELHPEVANTFDSLGEAYEREGNIDAARENYTRALEIAKANDGRMVSFYERRLRDLE